jgi:hypothetical protein
MSKQDEVPSLMDLFDQAQKESSTPTQSDDIFAEPSEKTKNDDAFWGKSKTDRDDIFLLRHYNDILPHELRQALDDHRMGFSQKTPLKLKFLYDTKMNILWVGIFLVIFGGIAGWTALDKAMVTLAPHAIAKGVVQDTATYRCGKNKSSTCYQITVSYVVNDKNYTQTDTVSVGLYNTAQSEGVIPVTYNLNDPYNHMEVGRTSWGTGDTLLVSAMVLAGLAYLYGSFYYYQKAHALKNRNALLLGKLTNVRTTSNKGTLTVHVEYRFTNPAGNDIRGKQSHPRNDLKKKQLPHKNLPIVVAYVDDKNHRIL